MKTTLEIPDTVHRRGRSRTASEAAAPFLACLLVPLVSFATAAASVNGLGSDAAANRQAIQQAVDAAAAAGGGRVVIPRGTWPCGSIELKSGIELHLEKDAVLLGSTNRRDYNANDAFPENRRSDAEEWSGGHLVWARHAENIAITGAGTIDGNGPAFFGACEFDSTFPWYKYGLKLHTLDRDWYRPGWMLAFFGCRNVRLADVTLARTPCWTCHFRCSDGIDVRGVTIDADRTIANSDGFSIDCTRNVRVADCVLKTGDDGFAIRASCERHAATNFCENIVVTNCDIWSCCFGLRFGVGTGTIRNVDVVETRIHESSDGFGFTPAWVNNARNCTIEDIRIADCTVEESVKPCEVNGPEAGDWRVTGIRFDRCRFSTLLPSWIPGGDKVDIAFADCTRACIPRMKVRHRRGWAEQEIRNKRLTFAEGPGVRAERCLPRPFGSSGVLLLSFDDRNFAAWEKALPLFAQYGAHATFFLSGDMDATAVHHAKRLVDAGHSVGLHGARHANVPPMIAAKGGDAWYAAEIAKPRRQCDVSYVPIRTFAYPNNLHDAASDTFLLGRFDRLRAGVPGLRPYDPKGEKRGTLKPMIKDNRLFVPVSELPKRRILEAVILGEAYNTDIAEVLACIRRAAERKEALSLSSHGIAPDAKHINLKSEWLEAILKTARECGLAVPGFDEIPLVK